jgi:Putative auto-transporter adhesin, head GIN domain
MERRTLVLLIVAAVAISAVGAWLTLAGLPLPRRAAADEVTAVQRDLAPFHAIAIRGAADVVLVQGSAPSIRVEASGDAPVTAHVDNERLVIAATGTRRGWRRFFHSAPRERSQVTVTFVAIDRLETSGSGRLRASTIRVPRLAIDVSGSARIDFEHLDVDELAVSAAGSIKANLAGRATHQRIDIAGASDYQAANLVGETAAVNVSGAGNVTVNAAKTLDVDISGVGQVSYVGNPQLTKSVTGLGHVRQIEGRGEVRTQAPQPAPSPLTDPPRILVAAGRLNGAVSPAPA